MLWNANHPQRQIEGAMQAIETIATVYPLLRFSFKYQEDTYELHEGGWRIEVYNKDV